MPKTALRAIESPLEILVVDELAMNCYIAQTLLERAGHFVDVASNAASSILACSQKKYDLVFMDVQMSGINGAEATRLIRTLDQHAATMPVIAMTANVMTDQIALCHAAGMNDLLAKPIDFEQLLVVLKRWTTPSDSKTAPEQVSSPNSVEHADNPVHDRRMLDALRELGSLRTQLYLRKLSETLGSDVWKGDADNQELIKAAHMTISLAGQLGFSQLSAAAYDIEAASLGEHDFDAASVAFQAARANAVPVLDGFIAEQHRFDTRRRATRRP